MKISLDDLDHKILQILESDGRAPAKFIAEKLSVNEVTVSKRLTKIIEGGFCKIIAIADFEKCGFEHLLPIGIRVHGLLFRLARDAQSHTFQSLQSQ